MSLHKLVLELRRRRIEFLWLIMPNQDCSRLNGEEILERFRHVLRPEDRPNEKLVGHILRNRGDVFNHLHNWLSLTRDKPGVEVALPRETAEIELRLAKGILDLFESVPELATPCVKTGMRVKGKPEVISVSTYLAQALAQGA